MNERGLAVSARQISKRFFQDGKEIAVLRGLSFEVAAGEQVGIVGASGAGKSTLLHILGGVDEPNEGQVLLDGEALYRLSDPERSRFRNRQIGFVFQFHHLLPEFSAVENVALPLRIAGGERQKAQREAEAMLERTGLGERLHHRPSQLSGGEQQRVAIARALIMKPRLLLVDEPTGNLDSVNGEKIASLILDFAAERGMTLLVVTHNPELAARLPRVARLKDGVFVDGQKGKA